MIDVQHLTRRFAGHVAVDDLSFRLPAGEVMVLLGPNGAGKTTTIRLLAGTLQPTGGRIRVGGRDWDRDGLELRRHIGYLPEQAPVYPELRVREHLDLMGGLYGLPQRLRLQRLDWCLNACGLEPEAGRIIGTLSRGYRQRVGLATALLHDPEVLILDEPTAGLDPNQTRAFQGVIRSLAGSRTILMATHSLAEADALGHRILILHRGRLAAWDTPAALRRGAAGTMRVTAEVRAPFETVRRTCDTLLFADRVDLEPVGEWVRLRLSARGDADLRTDLYQLAVREGWGLRELHIDLPTLEAVFARITGEEGDHG